MINLYRTFILSAAFIVALMLGIVTTVAPAYAHIASQEDLCSYPTLGVKQCSAALDQIEIPTCRYWQPGEIRDQYSVPQCGDQGQGQNDCVNNVVPFADCSTGSGQGSDFQSGDQCLLHPERSGCQTETDSPSAKTKPGNNGSQVDKIVLITKCGLDFFTGGFVGEIVKGAGDTLKIVKVIRVLKLAHDAKDVHSRIVTFFAVVKDLNTHNTRDAEIRVALELVPFADCFQLIGPATLHALHEVIYPPQAY